MQEARSFQHRRSPTARERQLAADEKWLIDRREVAAALKGAGNYPAGEGSAAVLPDDTYSKIYSSFVYDSFVMPMKSPPQPAKATSPQQEQRSPPTHEPFHWDLQDLFGGSVGAPMGHGQSFVFGELPRFPALPPHGTNTFHHDMPKGHPILPGIEIEYIGGGRGRSQPSTPAAESYSAALHKRRLEAKEEQLYGRQLGEKLRIYSDKRELEIRAKHANALHAIRLKKLRCPMCRKLDQMAQAGTYKYRQQYCDDCGSKVDYPYTLQRQKVIMRWRKAAISITRGKEEASRIFDNPNATSDDTDVFFGATDPLFGNSRIRSEQETETLLLQLKRKRMQAAAELAIQNALQNAADREAEEDAEEDAMVMLADEWVKEQTRIIRERAEQNLLEREAAGQFERTKRALLDQASKVAKKGGQPLLDLLSPLAEPIIAMVGDDLIVELLTDIVTEDKAVVDYCDVLMVEVLDEIATEAINEYREEQIANDAVFGDIRTSKSARARVEDGTQSLLDYLYMFCLISMQDLDDFRRAFDAADQDGDGMLNTNEAMSAISIICGASAVEFQAADIAGYLGMLTDGLSESKMPFHLFTIIAAMSQKVAKVLTSEQTLPAGTVLGTDGTRTLPDGTKLLLDGTVVLLTGVQLLPNGDTLLQNGTVLRSDGTKILSDGRKVLQDGRVFMANGAAAPPLDDDEIKATRGGSAARSSRSARAATTFVAAAGNRANGGGAAALDATRGGGGGNNIGGGDGAVASSAANMLSGALSGLASQSRTGTTNPPPTLKVDRDRVNPAREGAGVEFTGSSLLKTKEAKFRLGRQLLVMLRRAKQYFFLCNVDRADGKVPLSDVEAELVAGQMDAQEVNMIVRGMKQAGLHRIGFLDFLDYAPLFAQIHDNIVENPMSLDEKALMLNALTVFTGTGQFQSQEAVSVKAASKWQHKAGKHKDTNASPNKGDGST